MKLNFSDLLDKHKDIPCAITAHGPSLNFHKYEILQAQKEKKIIRLSVNNWWDFFDSDPDYWILSNTDYTMEKYMNFLNQKDISVFFSDDGDFTSKEFIEQNAKFNWLAYDQRHWEGKDCLEILMEFKNYYEKNKNFKFNRFGNNEVMWHPPRCHHNSGHSLNDRKCCDMNISKRITVQEYLQNLTKTEQHYSTGDSVAIHAIAFAIIMGCNPIYVSGMDLDYSKGYANNKFLVTQDYISGPSAFTPVRENFYNDLTILNQSASSRGINLINLCPDPWYDCFKVGRFTI